jgi:ATP-dependent RNA helicase RhlE
VSFTSFDFHPQIAAGIHAAGYQTPTPIQVQAMPAVLAGRDVIGLAQTGTGKTAAFGLPILQRLMQGPRGKVRALIVAPTRELAEQIHNAIMDLAGQTRLRSMTLYGGVGMQPQIQKLRAGAEIVVACPGRLLDHLKQRNLSLTSLEVLVLDEADRMFDMGFLPDVRRLLTYVPAKRQTLLFSATMPPDVDKLAREILHDPVTVKVNHLQPLTTITHALYPVPAHLKTPLLLGLLAKTDTNSVLVFTRTKHRAKKVGLQLQGAGFNAASLQGNLSQNRRQAALDGFREGKYQILVATDIAARGIDVSQISHVINYDIPDTAEAYTHRIGRTGRMERTGDAFTLTTSEDHEMVRAIERALGAPVEKRYLPGFDYKAPNTAPEQRGGSAGRGRRPESAPRSNPQRPGRPGSPSHGSPTPSHGPSNGSATRRPGGPATVGAGVGRQPSAHAARPASRRPSSVRRGGR